MSALFQRKTEAGLLILGVLVVLVSIVALEISQGNQITREVFYLVGGYLLIFLVAHAVICFRAPNADQLLLPIAALLNGLGLVMIYRLDLVTEMGLAQSQVMWMVLGAFIMCVALFILRDHRSLLNYSFILGIGGLILLALPIVWPTNLNADANVWISIGRFSIQPGEFAKIAMLLFMAAMLVSKRRLFSTAGRHVLGMQFPRVRDLGPLLLMWLIALVIMGLQNDFGPALLLFGTVLGMLYIATGKGSWLVLGLGLAAAGAVAVYQISSKIQSRVANFIDPIGNYEDKGLQLSQSLFGMSFGGVTGTGLGEGYPYKVPVAHSDFILAAFGEELGLIGVTAILLTYAIFVTRTFRTAMLVEDSYGKLVASGLALTIAIQIFVVAGGISRLLPMTGLTTPFIAHGGSSLLANYLLLAIILRISDSARSSQLPDAPTSSPVSPGAGAQPLGPGAPGREEAVE